MTTTLATAEARNKARREQIDQWLKDAERFANHADVTTDSTEALAWLGLAQFWLARADYERRWVIK